MARWDAERPVMAGAKIVESKGKPMTKDGLRQVKQKWKDNMIKAIVNDDLATAAALIQERSYWDTMESIIDTQEARNSLADRVLAIEKTLGQTPEEKQGIRLASMEERIEDLKEGLDKAFREIEQFGKPRPKPRPDNRTEL